MKRCNELKQAVFNVAVEYRGYLCAGRAVFRHEVVVVAAVYDALGVCPCHCLARNDRDAVVIDKARDVFGGAHVDALKCCIAVEYHRHLLAGYAFVGCEGFPVKAVDYAVFGRPIDRRAAPDTLGVVKGRGLCLGLTLHAPEHRHEHSARHGRFGGEGVRTRAVEQAVVIGVGDISVAPVIVGNIEEGEDNDRCRKPGLGIAGEYALGVSAACAGDLAIGADGDGCKRVGAVAIGHSAGNTRRAGCAYRLAADRGVHDGAYRAVKLRAEGALLSRVQLRHGYADCEILALGYVGALECRAAVSGFKLNICRCRESVHAATPDLDNGGFCRGAVDGDGLSRRAQLAEHDFGGEYNEAVLGRNRGSVHGRTAAAHGNGGKLKSASKDKDCVVVGGEVCVPAHGVSNVEDEIVYFGLDSLGKYVVKLYGCCLIAEGVGLYDAEDLVEDLAAFYLVKTGLHPCGEVAVVLAAEVALVDVVYGVKQGLVLGHGDVHEVADYGLNLVDYPADHPVGHARLDENDLAEEIAEEVASDVAEHILGEAEGAAVLGEVVNAALLARDGIDEAHRANMIFGRDIDDHCAVCLAQLNKAGGGGVCEAGAGLDIVHGVAVFSSENGDILRVHVAGEYHFHAGVCKLCRDALIVLYKVHGEDVRLHREMGHKAVMRQADDAVAARLGSGYLLDSPCLKLGAHLTAGLVLNFALGVVVGTVATGVERDEGYAVGKLRNVGKLAGFLALGGSVACYDALVGVDKVVNFREIRRLGARCGDGDAVRGVEILGMAVADVVVAVDYEYLQAGNVLFKLLEALGEDLMALKLAVLGEVAGDEQNVGLVLSDGIQKLKIDRVALYEHLAVAVEGIGEIVRVLDHGRRQVVNVAEHGDLQLLVVLAALVLNGQRRHCQRKDHDEREKHRE